VRIAVADNGQGIEPDKLAKLLLPESSRGIGLWNIDNRLKKLYGTGLTIESSPGQGTCVSYLIPLEVLK
jgi:sensor histidine kinase YesM